MSHEAHDKGTTRKGSREKQHEGKQGVSDEILAKFVVLTMNNLQTKNREVVAIQTTNDAERGSRTFSL